MRIVIDKGDDDEPMATVGNRDWNCTAAFSLTKEIQMKKLILIAVMCLFRDGYL